MADINIFVDLLTNTIVGYEDDINDRPDTVTYRDVIGIHLPLPALEDFKGKCIRNVNNDPDKIQIYNVLLTKCACYNLDIAKPYIDFIIQNGANACVIYKDNEVKDEKVEDEKEEEDSEDESEDNKIKDQDKNYVITLFARAKYLRKINCYYIENHTYKVHEFLEYIKKFKSETYTYIIIQLCEKNNIKFKELDIVERIFDLKFEDLINNCSLYTEFQFWINKKEIVLPLTVEGVLDLYNQKKAENNDYKFNETYDIWVSKLKI